MVSSWFLIVARSRAIGVIPRQKNSGSEKFLQRREKFSEGKGKRPKIRKKNSTMKDGDTITTVITFLLVLPWLARVVVSSKAIWRALMEGHNKKRKQTI
jgi:hypothetical protein